MSYFDTWFALLPEERQNTLKRDGFLMARMAFLAGQSLSQKKLTARRETDTTNPISGMKHNGKWVVRDENSKWVDSDQYRNDLLCRFDNLEIMGD